MKLIKRTLATILLSASALASATPVYVGSWELYSGPSYLSLPSLYTGQQAAAALFGGDASDYVISTVGSDAAQIDFQAWYDQYGRGVDAFAQDYMYDIGIPGQYETDGDASALVADHYYTGEGDSPYVNYAFRVNGTGTDVPEPMSVGLLGAGLLVMALVRRRRASRR